MNQDAKVALVGLGSMTLAFFGLLLLTGKSSAEEPPAPSPPPPPPPPPTPPRPTLQEGEASFSDLPLGSVVVVRQGLLPGGESVTYRVLQKAVIDGRTRYVGEQVGTLGGLLGGGAVGVFSESDVVARVS